MRHPDNPLLQAYDLPPFSDIKAEHFSPALDQILAESRATITEIIKTQRPFPTWDDLVLAMDAVHERLKSFSYVLNRLTSTKPGAAWEKASMDCEERLQAFRRSLKQHPELQPLYQRLADSQIGLHFSAARKRTLKKILRQFHQNGTASPAREELNDLKLRIRGARALFLEHLQEANKAWSKTFDDEDQLKGLPSSFKLRMADQARSEGRTGWLLRLNDESFRIVMRYADNSALRKQMYVAYSTRASDQGPNAGMFDNAEVLSQLVRDRHRFAVLLGYPNFAAMAIEPEQAESPEQVVTFLEGLLEQQRDRFLRDTEQLEKFAARQGSSGLQFWNYQYLAEQCRRQMAGVSEQTVSAWFELESTFSQLLGVVRDLFGVNIIERHDVRAWHPQVRLFEVLERDEPLGYIYFDPFADPSQDGFPHTTTLRNRRITAEGRPRYPIAALHAWLPRSSGVDPVLLDHRQLQVLFHELGHCLHHVLTRAEYHDVSGITELSRDTAEFAGVLFEQWCLSKSFLLRISRHHRTGAPLPEKLADQLLVYLRTQASWNTADSLRDALFDIELHRSHGDGRTAQQIFDRIRTHVGHLPAFTNERWPNGLDYMVTGYAAGIYAYLWANSAASVVFQRIERDGLFNRRVGQALRETLFEPGDSRPLSESIAAFMAATAHGVGARA